MLLRPPDVDEAESSDASVNDVAAATETNEAVVRAIAMAIDERDRTPRDSKSSGRTYERPADECGDF